MLGAVTACKSKKQVLTPAQREATNTGRVKLEQDECQKLAFQGKSDVLRAWGEFISRDSESFANDQAELAARTKIARQVEMSMESMISNYNEQYSKSGARDASGKAQQLQQGYVNRVLTGSVPICSNTYVLPTGEFQAYVCVELSADKVQAVVKQLSAEAKLDIDFAEHNYRQEMEKAREQFNQSQGR
jgi:hypothetical protein